MARRGFSQNLPNFVKGGCTVGACTYQSSAARAFHDDDEGAVAAGGADPSLVAMTEGPREEGKLSPHQPQFHRGPISSKEVEEASRILFAPVSRHQQQHQQQASAARNRPRADSDDGSYEEVPSPQRQQQQQQQQHRHDDVGGDEEAAAVAPPPPMYRARSRGAVGGLSSLASPTPAAPPPSLPLHEGAAGTQGQGGGDSSSLVGQLHPKPAVHAEILRFGMTLAANPRIQSVIREELELRGGSGHGGGGGGGGGALLEEGDVEGMAVAMRRLCGLSASVAEGDDDEEGLDLGLGGSAASSFLTASYEMVGRLAGGGGGGSQEGEEEEEGVWGQEQPPGASFLSLGRSIRVKDCVVGAPGPMGQPGRMREEVLDELLRSDDEDDAITQKLFASTPDESVRRYLRNLDLECVICHEYMVEATAVDCGEGHTFCRECVGAWLEQQAAESGKRSCPTCQRAVAACIPMRQYDAMIEKYVRASNLWDEITSYYRRKTLARMKRELAREAQEQEAEAEAETRRRREQGPGQRASEAFMNAFAGLGSLFGGPGAAAGAAGGPTVGGAEGLRRRQRGAAASAGGNATATDEGANEGRDGGERWWKSEILHKALSVATMLILVVLFRRGGVKVR